MSLKASECAPEEIALKSFFLGPQAENIHWVIEIVQLLVVRWGEWRKRLFPDDGEGISVANQNSPEFIDHKRKFNEVTFDLFKRFEDEMPKFSPRYAGHMLSEISLPALFGHVITLLHNPNNISGEASKVGIQIEHEAIQELLQMVGYSFQHGTGHFTSGGTLANFEALIRAHARSALWFSISAAIASRDDHFRLSFDPFRASHLGWKRYDELRPISQSHQVSAEELKSWNFEQRSPHQVFKNVEKLTGSDFLGPVVLVPENKHYSWKKGVRFLGLGDDALWPIELDEFAKLSLPSLKRLIERAKQEGRPILMVVSVAGTTELGTIDPVDEVQAYLDELCETEGLHIWHHVDAAYGGFFRTVSSDVESVLSSRARNALGAIPSSTSTTLDPHKLGYVPYASGTFLTREKRDYYFNAFEEAPYIDFDPEVDRGPYTIEGSRSAGGAVATWMTAKIIGLDRGGYGLLLERTLRLRESLSLKLLQSGAAVRIIPANDTNILCFSCAREGEPLSVSNARTLKVYEAYSPKKNGPFIV